MRRVSTTFPLFLFMRNGETGWPISPFLRPYFRQGLSAFLRPNLRYGLTAFLRSNFTAWTFRFRKEVNDNAMCIIINSLRSNSLRMVIIYKMLKKVNCKFRQKSMVCTHLCMQNMIYFAKNCCRLMYIAVIWCYLLNDLFTLLTLTANQSISCTKTCNSK